MKKQAKQKETIAHTSVSLNSRHKEKLQNAAQYNNISLNDLMVILLRYINERSLNFDSKSLRVRYQLSEGDMQILNLYISQQDYERNIDARRYAKFSVSWLLAYAIEHFLDIVIRKISENLFKGKEILNNYLGAQTYLIKKFSNRIKFVSIWYPQKE